MRCNHLPTISLLSCRFYLQ